MPEALPLEVVLDRVLIPRANGTEGLARVADFLSTRLRALGAEVAGVPFDATPGGFALIWSVAAVLMLGGAVALVRRADRTVVGCVIAVSLLLVSEMELLWTPLTGLLLAPERNIVGDFGPGAPAPLLILSAHYDSATNFGDHFDWYWWGYALGPALLLAGLTGIVGWWRAGRNREVGSAWRAGAAVIAVVPFAMMAWFFAAGPWLRAPSPGALDNGGAVVALLRLGERLAAAPARAIGVRLIFFAAEEERALGSWRYAEGLVRDRPLAVVNLETIGADGGLVYAADEGFQFRRYPASRPLVELVQAAAGPREESIVPELLPAGVITDARSFLAQGIPAVSLLSVAAGGFPRALHSAADDRGRLSASAIERVVEVLEGCIRIADTEPGRLLAASGS